MARTTSFSLSEEQQKFIREQVRSGAYGSTSELVRDAIDALAEESQKEALWRESLAEGLASGRARPGVFARVRKKQASR